MAYKRLLKFQEIQQCRLRQPYGGGKSGLDGSRLYNVAEHSRGGAAISCSLALPHDDRIPMGAPEIHHCFSAKI